MADLGLPCSPWACYEAWQNNSDRWWQMSLRARLGVGAHANETNETLCVSFSHRRHGARMHKESHVHVHTGNMKRTEKKYSWRWNLQIITHKSSFSKVTLKSSSFWGVWSSVNWLHPLQEKYLWYPAPLTQKANLKLVMFACLMLI